MSDDEEQPVNETAERDVAASLMQARWAETNQIDGVRYQQIACVAADAAWSTFARLQTRQSYQEDKSLRLKRREVMELASQAQQMAFGYYANERGG